MSRSIIAFVILLSSAIAMAEPISYDEAVDGDLDRTDVFAFGAGDNIIAGSSQIAGTLIAADDPDFFWFVIPDYHILTRFTLSYEGGLTPGANVSSAQMFYNIRDTATNFDCTLSGARPNVLSGTGSMTTSTCGSGSELMWSDLGAGTYYVRHNLSSFGGDTGDSWNYSLAFTVAPDPSAVPEPGTLLLLGSGLMAMGAMRRRRKA